MSKTTKLMRVKALPWAVLLQGGMLAGRRWRALSEDERSRLTQLVRESHGRLGNLTAKERSELKKLVDKLDLTGIGREMLPLFGAKHLRTRP